MKEADDGLEVRSEYAKDKEVNKKVRHHQDSAIERGERKSREKCTTTERSNDSIGGKIEFKLRIVLMNLLFWNMRGIHQCDSVTHPQEMIRAHDPRLLVF